MKACDCNCCGVVKYPGDMPPDEPGVGGQCICLDEPGPERCSHSLLMKEQMFATSCGLRNESIVSKISVLNATKQLKDFISQPSHSQRHRSPRHSSHRLFTISMACIACRGLRQPCTQAQHIASRGTSSNVPSLGSSE